MEKCCTACNQSKPIGEFYLSRGKPCSPCKSCAVKKAAHSAWARPEARKANLAKWRATADRSKELLRTAQRATEIRAAFPALVREADRLYYAENAAHFAAAKSQWREENPDRVKSIRKKHASTEKARTGMRVRQHERRAMERKAKPSWYDSGEVRQFFEVARVLSRSGVKFSVDHVVPLKGRSVCGLHVQDNLRVIPLWQNIAKNNRLEDAHG